jgi:hypothetical protein
MRFTFDDFVEYGRAHGANIVNGMPWSFTFYGEPVTHESDTLYLIGSSAPPLRFAPADVIQIERGEVVICNGAAELDMVLDAYAAESGGEFNAKVLADFIATYPKHRDALNRYAYIQLSSAHATPEEIAARPRYSRMPAADKRIARGDDFAGDAWLDTATGDTVYTVVGFDRNAVPTMAVENGSAVPLGVLASRGKTFSGETPMEVKDPK